MFRRNFLKALAPLVALSPVGASASMRGRGPACEVCGSPALVEVEDEVEVDPHRSPAGGMWPVFSVVSHAFCGRHARMAEARHRDGRIDYSRACRLIVI